MARSPASIREESMILRPCAQHLSDHAHDWADTLQRESSALREVPRCILATGLLAEALAQSMSAHRVTPDCASRLLDDVLATYHALREVQS